MGARPRHRPRRRSSTKPGTMKTFRISKSAAGIQGNAFSLGSTDELPTAGSRAVHPRTSDNLLGPGQGHRTAPVDVFLYELDVDGDLILDEPGDQRVTRISVALDGVPTDDRWRRARLHPRHQRRRPLHPLRLERLRPRARRHEQRHGQLRRRSPRLEDDDQHGADHVDAAPPHQRQWGLVGVLVGRRDARARRHQRPGGRASCAIAGSRSAHPTRSCASA